MVGKNVSEDLDIMSNAVPRNWYKKSASDFLEVIRDEASVALLEAFIDEFAEAIVEEWKTFCPSRSEEPAYKVFVEMLEKRKSYE